MQSASGYLTHTWMNGATRVELLLWVYDRAITSLQACSEAREAGDSAQYNKYLMDAYKAILVIQSGLQAEHNEVAFNVARLLHFTLSQLQEQDIETAISILSRLRDGFASIAEEANQLEMKGEIPAMQKAGGFSASV